MLFFDTSVLVALYVTEDKTPKVEKLIKNEDTLAICPLSEVEFNSAISRLVRMKAIEKAQGHCIITEFQLHQKESMYTHLPIMQKNYDLAKDWLATFDAPLRALDAIHMAVAYTNDLTLITADAALAKAAKTFGIPVKKI